MPKLDWWPMFGFMLPDIAALVYERLENPASLAVKHDTSEVERAVLRQLDDVRSGSKLRLSASGSCIRQLAYGWHNYKPTEKIDGASRLNFMVGDMLEAAMVAVLQEAFAQHEGFEIVDTGSGQQSVYVHVPLGDGRSLDVPGHPDGLMRLPIWEVDNPNEVFREKCLLELKSMSDYGFKKFQKEGLNPSDAYYSQVQSYMLATGTRLAYVLAWGKSANAKAATISGNNWTKTPPVCGVWISEDKAHQNYIINRFQEVANSASIDEFDRPYGPNKKGMLTFPCEYCSYMSRCFPNRLEKPVETKWLQKQTKVRVFTKEK